MQTGELELKRVNDVAVVTIARPWRRNSMDQALVSTLRDMLRMVDRETDIGAMVLYGATPGFCAGSDLKFLGGLTTEAMCDFEQECADLGRLIGLIRKPIVAAVEGFAIGGGFTLATSCDVVVAGRNSKWSLPEVPIGWLTPWGIKSLIARVGAVKARTLCFCLEPLSAVEAKDIGIIDYLSDDEQVLDAGLEVAHKLASLPRPAVVATKRFFSNYIMKDAEVMDCEANRLFAENSREPAAKATFMKFAGSSVQSKTDCQS